MNRLASLVLLTGTLLLSIAASAQEIGQPQNDPFTGQPTSVAPPVTIPDTTPTLSQQSSKMASNKKSQLLKKSSPQLARFLHQLFPTLSAI
jgi:hypothetical protein